MVIAADMAASSSNHQSTYEVQTTLRKKLQAQIVVLGLINAGEQNHNKFFAVPTRRDMAQDKSRKNRPTSFRRPSEPAR